MVSQVFESEKPFGTMFANVFFIVFPRFGFANIVLQKQMAREHIVPSETFFANGARKNSR
jgi:hypothetical protein